MNRLNWLIGLLAIFERLVGRCNCNRGRRFIAGARYEHTTYQIFMSGSAWPTIDKS